MKRASFLLETARLDRELTLEEISKKTKIPKHYLQAFESENTCDFPDEPYCTLMLREYSVFLNLDPEQIISLFRRDFSKKNIVKNKSFAKFSFTPQFTYVFGVLVLVCIFAGYLIFEYIKFNQPPKLTVNWPTGINKVVEISGSTDSESTVKINQDLVVVDQDGSFVKKLELSTSEAKIVVEAMSPAGKTTTIEKTIK